MCDKDTRTYQILLYFSSLSILLVHSRNLKRLLLTPIWTWLTCHSRADCICICGYHIRTSVKLVVTQQSYSTIIQHRTTPSCLPAPPGSISSRHHYNGIFCFLNLLAGLDSWGGFFFLLRHHCSNQDPSLLKPAFSRGKCRLTLPTASPPL